MLTHFLVIVAATAAASLTWRTLKDDHPKLKRWVADLPIVGAALSCGFCATMWFSLAAVLLANPLPGYQVPFTIPLYGLLPVATTVVVWFAVGTAVLLVRALIVVLLELGGNLKHQHANRHSHGAKP